MCATCGCVEGTDASLTDLQSGWHVHVGADGREYTHPHSHGHDHSPDHDHGHEHPHPRSHDHAQARTVQLERSLLSKNDRLAERNRGWLDARGIRAVNLMSSPGAGKTTLLERTISQLGAELKIRVIEGDQATTRDSERIRAAGGAVIQINTGAGCHLDADMVGRALRELDPPEDSLVMIENVGNLVCPSMFDLGERAKVVVTSVTEGDDKPAKYPHMFRAADIVVLNKMDLLPHVNFKVAAFTQTLRELNPRAQIFQTSATRGDDLDAWYGWLRETAEKISV